LKVAGHYDDERAKDVGALLVEAACDRAVDAGGKVLHGAVPADGDAARSGEDLFAVHEMELELGQLVGQAAPVAVEDVSVVVVLG